MPYPMIQTCPTCNHTLHATRLECSNCHTTIENHFEFSKFSTLNEEQLHFIEVFLLSRGNIKEVEKELGISYPTVRGKLNDIIAKLGHRKREKTEPQDKSRIITMFENGEINTDEAIELLQKKRGDEE
ncbi:DUF2089 domain-containing protein [Oceanobacillus neutriphilus]|uniref:DUF2089 domain-containing protein n=1 Tax=Oceanobacillus neutriphilus TaxID=531815 RepID=A0ABQ2P3Q0_9BACI|nr:DUF2089 domain-containing protein [Oceanobacillus neutriphilus]GGP17078.1 hypothetical protein GCM10011346_51620 [Oceanobacillus neutriphilus]